MSRTIDRECQNCFSRNKLIVRPGDDAFECINCLERQWLSMAERDEYMLMNNVSERTIDECLHNGRVIFAVNWY